MAGQGIERQVDAGRVLVALAGASWIARSGADGWVLARDADAIKVEEIYRLFVFNTAAHIPARRGSAELDALVFEISTHIARHLQMSLADLFLQTERDGNTTPAAALSARR